MAFTRFILPALSVAATAYAASCSSDGTATVNPADVSGCPTYTGNIVVASGAASGGSSDFGKLAKVDGDFTYEGDASVQTISLGSLKEVTGDLKLSNLSALSSTGLSVLTTVGGDLVFEGLGVNDLGLNAGLEEVGTVTIINTQIQTLDGLSGVSKIAGLTVSDNLNLGEISLGVSEIDLISIGAGQQANGGQSANFTNLENAKSIVIRNSSSVDLSSLGNVTNDLRLIGNTFESFAATKLESVGALVINSNGFLKNISFPALTQVRSKNATLQIANNTKLNDVSGLPELETVTGDVYIFGNFSKLELNSINRIDGALRVETASDTFDCKNVDGLSDDKVVKGKEVCKIGDKSKLNGAGSSTGSSSSDGAAASSSNFVTPLEIPAEFMSGFAVLASLLSMVL